VCIQGGRIDHRGLLFAMSRRQADHHPGEVALVGTPLTTFVKRLVRAVFLRRVPPPQAIAIEEDNPAQDLSVIDAWLTVALEKAGLQTRYLRVA
jgi:hypothetical protein